MPTAPVYFGHMESSLKATMLFPNDPARARAFAAWLTLRNITEARQKGAADFLEAVLEKEDARRQLLEVASAASGFVYLKDAQEHADDGSRAGMVVACLWALISTNPDTASWEDAIKAAEAYFARYNKNLAASRKLFRKCLSRFKPVLHLLGARTLRRGVSSASLDRIVDMRSDPASGYFPSIDILFFAQEARMLQIALTVWNSRRAPSSEYLKEMLDLNGCWVPPPKQAGWPDNTGKIEYVALDPWIRIEKGPVGRPRKTLSQVFAPAISVSKLL